MKILLLHNLSISSECEYLICSIIKQSATIPSRRSNIAIDANFGYNNQFFFFKKK